MVWVIGTGVHAGVVGEILINSSKLDGFVDMTNTSHTLDTKLGYPIVHVDKVDLHGKSYCVGIGSNFARESVTQQIERLFPSSVLTSAIHSTAFVSPFATIHAGSVIGHHAVILTNCVVGTGCMLLTKSSLDHDGIMHPYSSLAPSVTCGGNVQIGERTAICIGSVVKNKICIASDVVVGSCSYVHKDILTSHQVWFGSPAKYKRDRDTREPYL